MKTSDTPRHTGLTTMGHAISIDLNSGGRNLGDNPGVHTTNRKGAGAALTAF